MHNELIELIAESDESLLEIFFDKGELSEEELRSGLHQALKSGGLIPVFCVSGETNTGVKRMMDILARYAPCAGDFEKVEGTHPDSGDEVLHGPSINDPLAARVFKTISEEHIGEMSFFRVYSGKVNAGDDLRNTTRNNSEKMRQIYFMNGKNRKDASQLIAGDIGAALKLKNTHTGDTLADPKGPILLPKINYPTPNMSYAVKPKARGDEEKIANGLAIMHEEDPTFLYRVDSELKQTIISGQGELHLNIAIKRISERFHVELEKETPKVPYRETISGKAEAKYRHKKQSGGSGQFAEVWLRIEAANRGEGIEFKNSLVGQNVDRGFVPSVEKGINHICNDGVIAGCKVVDININFYDGKMHPVDSNDMAFQIAGRHAFMDAVKSARPKLLEPIYSIKVKIPDDVMGDIMGDISSRRGKVQGMETDGHFQIINAEVPMANLHDYATALKAMSSGRGMFTNEFSHYEDMPHIEADKVISKWEAARAAGE
jgi:elongation factor G